MLTKVEIWTIQELYDNLNIIQEQPKYQRGPVWKPLKRQMLIDSILRGIDIPKIYLRRLDNALYKYEVADGQQRIIAIKDFINKSISLSNKNVNGLDLSKIGKFEVADKNIEEVNFKLKDYFLKFELTIAVVEDASNSEIRTLFGRLQMGDSLNPAEKRNALISNLGTEIDNIVLHHNFFTNCKIPPERFKRQDYLTHVLALMHYGNKYDLKANVLNKLYNDCSKILPQNLISDAVKVLENMHELEKICKKKIVNKWTFVDIFRLFLENIKKKIDYSEFSKIFVAFEKRRALYSSKPEKLILGKKPTREENDLYQYITSFKSNGGNPKNLDKRFIAFQHIFAKTIN